jgi:CRISPR-associated protein Csb2
VPYDSPPVRLLFELRDRKGDFFPWPFTDVVRLVEIVRNGAAEVLPDQRACIDRVFGRCRDATEADKASRIRILPLPSIGHVHAERSIRRLLVEVPPDCPLHPRDVAWAFTAWTPHDPDTGEFSGWQLVEIGADAGDRYKRMPRHYGIGDDLFRRWRTVTPAALPECAARRRIDPARRREEAKGGAERAAEEQRAAAAVRDALRHAGVATPVESIRVQREPFEAKGARAEDFASGTRFSSFRLWHVEIAFAAPRPGPVVIGDGRYLGLGLMAPVNAPVALHAFAIPAFTAENSAALLAQALRRAVMVRVRDVLKKRPDEGLPLFFCGHEPDGAPARAKHEHLFFAVEPGPSARLLILAPHIVGHRPATAGEVGNLRTLDAALSGFVRLTAGSAGVLELAPLPEPQPGDPLLGPARTWESRVPFRPTRHASRGKDLAAAVVQDVLVECGRRGLPRPDADVLDLTAGPKGGNLAARIRLRFAVAVNGPLLLGRDSHTGGGLFAVADEGMHPTST